MAEERTRRIQERAHSLWEQEGRPDGRNEQHWSRAEREIDAEDAAGASSPTGITTARRQPKRRAGTKTVADTSSGSQEEATGMAAEVSAEEPVKTRVRKPKTVTEEGSEQPKARGGRSSKVAAEVSAEQPVKTRGRKPKAVTEDGSLEDMLAAQPAKRQQAEPKYRHPENAELTWSGRGRKPSWIAEALDAGKSLDDFAI